MTTHLPQATLSREEALQLWLSERSEYAKEQMVLANQNLVHTEIAKMKLKKDEDLFMYGIYGLCKAILKYDSEKEVTFSTFAVPVIKNEILRTFAKKRIVPAMSVDEPVASSDGLCLKNIIPDMTDYEGLVVSRIWENWIINMSMKNLTKKQGIVVRLICVGFSQKEVAEMLHMSHQNISKLMARARERMEKERWNDLSIK